MPERPPAVTPFPGTVRQISFVVRDLDVAIRDWLTLGVGPWFVLRGFRAVGSTYRDEPFDPLLSLAFANSGDLQVELIAVEDDTPSMYREFLDSGRQGFQHVAYWAVDVAAAHERALAQGWRCVQSGSLPFHYYDVSNELGLVVEVSVLNDRMRAIAAAIRDAAQDWDGVDRPVRDYPPPSASAVGSA
jgi:catechol 2,3-dioxygenase-like lactoylglutathione lyase family enzyme